MQVGFVKNPGKICENPFKVPKNSGTDVSTPLFLIVWWMRLTDKTRLILTFLWLFLEVTQKIVSVDVHKKLFVIFVTENL